MLLNLICTTCSKNSTNENKFSSKNRILINRSTYPRHPPPTPPQDTKHGDRIRLENYAYLEAGIGTLARCTPRLEQAKATAQARLETALGVYV